MPRRSALRLTKRTVDALTAEAKDSVFWDRDLAGFGVRAHAAGRKVYIVQSQGPRRIAGEWPDAIRRGDGALPGRTVRRSRGATGWPGWPKPERPSATVFGREQGTVLKHGKGALPGGQGALIMQSEVHSQFQEDPA